MSLVRWAIRIDTARMIEIAGQYDVIMTPESIAELLGQRTVIGLVYENEKGEAIGFCIYEMFPDRYLIRSIMVDVNHTWKGVGRSMINKITKQLETCRRSRITTFVPMSNTELNDFFRKLGFKATKFNRNDDTMRFAFEKNS